MTTTTLRRADVSINGHMVKVSTHCADTNLAELLRWAEALENGLRANDGREALKARLDASRAAPVRKMRQRAQQQQARAQQSGQTLTFHTDAGHGWLQVPRKALFDLGIAASISRYSYVKGDFAFLEEDCDAPKYLAALKAH